MKVCAPQSVLATITYIECSLWGGDPAQGLPTVRVRTRAEDGSRLKHQGITPPEFLVQRPLTNWLRPLVADGPNDRFGRGSSAGLPAVFSAQQPFK